MSRLDSKQLAAMWHASPPQEGGWDIPKRAEHPSIDGILSYLAEFHQQCGNVITLYTDYQIIRLISHAQPENDLTRLCKCLCMDGAAQGLSDRWCTVKAVQHNWELDELFGELLPHLCSRSATQSFYDMCCKVNPDNGWRRACQKAFRSMDKTWRDRTAIYTHTSTAKWFLRRDRDHALFVMLFYPNLYGSITLSQNRGQAYLDPYSSTFAHILCEDPWALDQLGREILGPNAVPTPWQGNVKPPGDSQMLGEAVPVVWQQQSGGGVMLRPNFSSDNPPADPKPTTITPPSLLPSSVYKDLQDIFGPATTCPDTPKASSQPLASLGHSHDGLPVTPPIS